MTAVGDRAATRRSRWRGLDNPYAFLLPACLVFGMFALYPILRSLYLSFFHYEFLRPEEMRWVGLGNYREIFQDERVTNLPRLVLVLPEHPLDLAPAVFYLLVLAYYLVVRKPLRALAIALIGSGLIVLWAFARSAKTMAAGDALGEALGFPVASVVGLLALVFGSAWLTLNSPGGAFWNTIRFTIMYVPAAIVFPLILAVLVERAGRLSTLFRTLNFIPIVVSVAVISIIWMWVYHPDYGVVNTLLRRLAGEPVAHPGILRIAVRVCALSVVLVVVYGVVHYLRESARRWGAKLPLGARVRRAIVWAALGVTFLVAGALWLWYVAGIPLAHLVQPLARRWLGPSPGFAWLSDPKLAMPAIVAMCVWHGLGFNMLLYLVGLQRISAELTEAARVDGATGWKAFRFVTLPLLKPMVFLVGLLAAIGALKVFGQMFIMTQGGPADSTLSVVLYLYNVAFSYGKFRFGYASALAWALAVFIFLVTLVAFHLNRERQ